MTMRVAVLAAFPFPLPQGSQIYAAEQARALARCGADVTLLCYGHGVRGDAETRAHLDALKEAGVTLETAPAALSRTPLGAGPSLRKPVADLALLATLLRTERRQRFDAILAHNVEAACVALAARAFTSTPVVYVAHTLFGYELPSYAPAAAAAAARGLGRGLDRFVAGRSDAVVALSTAAETMLGAAAPGRVSRIAPALDPAPPPPPHEIVEACSRAQLARGVFAVYAGNLDAYQDLALLAAASRSLARDEVVVVSHDPTRRAPAGLRLVRARDAAEVRALVFGAALAVVPRRLAGGFPIKLLNYMEAGRAIVGFEGVADGFSHDRDAWLLPPHASAGDLAAALERLLRAPAEAARLGAAARLLLERRFGWEDAAARTLAVIEAVRGPQRQRGARSVTLRARSSR